MLTLKIRQNIHSSGCLRVENLAHYRAGSFLLLENGCCKSEEPFSKWRMVAASLREGFSDRRKLPAGCERVSPTGESYLQLCNPFSPNGEPSRHFSVALSPVCDCLPQKSLPLQLSRYYFKYLTAKVKYKF